MPHLALSRRTALLLAAAVLAGLFVASRVLGPTARPAVSVETPVSADAAQSAPRRPAAAARGALVVDVVGAVRRPGVYRLATGARVADAVARAGGTTARADPALLNLAAPLADGEQVVMPARLRDGGTPAPGDGSGTSPPAPIDLNTATAEQLDTLPGVGPVTAEKIVAYRQTHGPFASLGALDAIPGIGPARISQLEGLVVQR